MCGSACFIKDTADYLQHLYTKCREHVHTGGAVLHLCWAWTRMNENRFGGGYCCRADLLPFFHYRIITSSWHTTRHDYISWMNFYRVRWESESETGAPPAPSACPTKWKEKCIYIFRASAAQDTYFRRNYDCIIYIYIYTDKMSADKTREQTQQKCLVLVRCLDWQSFWLSFVNK